MILTVDYLKYFSMPNTNPSKEKDDQRFTDVQTDKRNHEHLRNEKDEITEEDIRNVKTDVSSASEKRKEKETEN